MTEPILTGRGRQITKVPYEDWNAGIPVIVRHVQGVLGFMSREHHLIRNFVVAELPKAGNPLSPRDIAGKLNLPVPRVNAILDELEKYKVFLFRNPQGEVVWAYPVTSEETPHRVTFSTGERIFAA